LEPHQKENENEEIYRGSNHFIIGGNIRISSNSVLDGPTGTSANCNVPVGLEM
jgi:hypothetical protein